MLFFNKSIVILMMAIISMVIAKPTVDHCSTCQSITEFFRVMEFNQTESVMKNNLFKMCLKENDGSNSRTCVFLATTVQNTLKHISNDNFCYQVNACQSTKPVERPISINKDRCEFCTELVDSMKSLLAENNVELLKKSLEQYCELTGDFKEECIDNLDKNLENFVDFVQTKMNSELFCNAVKSCHHQTIEEISSPTVGDLVSLRDPVQMAGHLEMIEKKKSESIEALSISGAKPNLKNPLTCMVCRQVVVIIYSQLHKNATRANVEHLLAKACKAIHPKDGQKQADCESKVVNNVDIILQSFINHVHPEIVCLITGMCMPGIEMDRPIKQIERIEDLESEDRSDAVYWAQGAKCYFCEKVVGFLFHELDEDKTREYVKHLLAKSCSSLFKKEEQQNKCQEYVNAYTDKLIDLIERADNPGLICNALHMCPANREMINQWDAKKLSGKIVDSSITKKLSFKDGPVFKIDWCKVCHKAYPILTDIVQIDEAKNRLSIVAHNLCERQILPVNVETCKTKADEYLNVIATVRDSNEGCKQLTLCPANQLTTEVKMEIDFKVIDLGSVESSEKDFEQLGWWDDAKCTACKLLIKGVYANLNKTIHSPSTRDFINRACEHIHQDELKDKCKADSMKALETLIKDFESNLPPQQACELMSYCPKKNFIDYSQITKPLLKNSVCNGCKTIFPTIHRLLQQENVRDVLLNVTSRICHRSSKPEKCKEVLERIINDLADSETADQGCATFCKDDLMSALGFPLSGCTRCQASMLVVEHLFNSEMVKHKLNSTLESFCESRNGETATKCKHVVRSNLPKLYQIVHNITDHDNGFCVSMGYCHKKTISSGRDFIELFGYDVDSTNDLLDGAEELLPNEHDLLDDPFSLNNGPNNQVCEGCKKVMARINEKIIQKKDFKEKLLKLFLKSCPEKDDKCRRFYKKYINYLYSELIRNTNPDRACPLIKLCPNAKDLYEEDPEPWTPEIELTEDTVCKECESAVNYLIKTLNDKTVIDFILQEIQKKSCEPLNFIERKACNRLLKSFGPKMIKKLVSRLNTNKICAKRLKLCKENSMDTLSNFDFLTIAQTQNCETCLRSMKNLNQLRGESSKRFSVKEICGEDDSACSDFMFNFEEFLQSETTNSDPLIACSDLDVCLIAGKVQLLGSDEKCKLGPSYWCMSAAHADACKKTEFCQQSYWQSVAN